MKLPFLKAKSYLLPPLLVFSLLLASILYACSGLNSLAMAFHHNSMSRGPFEEGPCGEAKPDFCASLRQRMISTAASATPADAHIQTLVPLPQSDMPAPLEIGLWHLLKSSAAFRPLSFKLPFIYLYPVLRI